MEHKDITNLEMEDMREQISALKQMLANEEIINDRILRSATSSRISTIQRKGILSIAIGILGAPYCAFVFYQLGLSWYFIGATIAMLIFCASCTAVMHNRVKSNTASTGSLLECAKQIKKLKKEYRDWFKIAIPMIIVWFGWCAAEMIMKTPDAAYAIGLVGGMLIGGIFGGFLGYRMHRKVVDTCDEILISLGEADD